MYMIITLLYPSAHVKHVRPENTRNPATKSINVLNKPGRKLLLIASKKNDGVLTSIHSPGLLPRAKLKCDFTGYTALKESKR